MAEQETLRRYAELKQQISKLEEELDLIKQKVFSSVDEMGGKFESDAFVLKTQKRPKYKFSDEYEAKSKELKALKKDEIDSGVATVEGYSEFVTIKITE